MRLASISTLYLSLGLAASAALQSTTAFEVFPKEVNLTTVRDRQSMVVRFTELNGVQRDVTADAKFTLADPSKAKVEKGTVTPLADGDTTMKVEWNGQSIDVPLKVEQAQVDPPISFRRDVMPVFLKSGCNAGGCHGASRGKDGFRLSLFGYDPEGDYFRLTHEMVGRRINLALPEESMILTKNIGTAPHTGGKVFTKDSEVAQTLLEARLNGLGTCLPRSASMSRSKYWYQPEYWPAGG